jgi:DNA-binding MarR family transcriptional regulator
VLENSPRIGVVAALVRSAHLVDRVYTEAAREFDLTAQQGQLLCVLMTRTYGMTDLGAALGLAKSSLTGLVDRTQRLDLVRREMDAEDTRAVRVALTPRGRRLAERFYAETARRVDALTAGLSTEESASLADLLAHVVADNKVPVVFMDLHQP